MANRYNDAIAINNGACNPLGITNTLLNLMAKMRLENLSHDDIRKDPALRVIVYQLAFSFGVAGKFDDYEECISECVRKKDGE
jgi:hypothetical protein